MALQQNTPNFELNFATLFQCAIPDDYRTHLASFTNESLAECLEYIGILEYDRMREAALRLVQCARIPSSQRDRLADACHRCEPIEFIKSVFRAAADSKEAMPLSDADIKCLSDFAVVNPAAGPADNRLMTAMEPETTDAVGGI